VTDANPTTESARLALLYAADELIEAFRVGDLTASTLCDLADRPGRDGLTARAALEEMSLDLAGRCAACHGEGVCYYCRRHSTSGCPCMDQQRLPCPECGDEEDPEPEE
jgi:hypothetical protein